MLGSTLNRLDSQKHNDNHSILLKSQIEFNLDDCLVEKQHM